MGRKEVHTVVLWELRVLDLISSTLVFLNSDIGVGKVFYRVNNNYKSHFGVCISQALALQQTS